MSHQKFNEIALKLRRLERIMSGLAADAERKAMTLQGDASNRTVDQGRTAVPDRSQIVPFDRRSLGQLLLQLRNSRHDHLEPELFSNASWDILLTLYVEGDAGTRPLSIEVVCQGAKIPVATGERWLALLSEKGLVRTRNNAAGVASTAIKLTGEGITSMEQYIDCAGAAIYEMYINVRLDAEIDGELVH